MNKKIIFIIILFMILLISLYLALYAGYNDIGVNFLYKSLDSDNPENFIFTMLRAPRVLKAFIAGTCLAIAGMFMQSVSKNPLAEPYITGISSGAGLGIVLSVLLFNTANYSFFGFAGALVVSLLVILFSGLNKFSITKLILIGLSLNIFISSLISFIILLNPLKSYIMVLILSGGITNNEMISDKFLTLLFVFILAVCVLFVPKLNYLRLDSELIEINKKKKDFYSVILIILSALLTSVSVFSAGILGFIGIIVPLISKIIFGQDYRVLFISNILLGSSLVLISDFLSRTIIYPLQIPLGLVIAFIGAPVFVFFLTKKGEFLRD